VPLNARQRKVLQRLLDDGDGGFSGGLVPKVHGDDGASKRRPRDLANLIEQNLLWTSGQGKGTRYYINVPGWTHGIGS
jgi:hypothetical protein